MTPSPCPKVMIYRFVTRNSFEGEMFARASKKLGLEQAILATHDFSVNGSAARMEATADADAAADAKGRRRGAAEEEEDEEEGGEGDGEGVPAEAANRVDAAELEALLRRGFYQVTLNNNMHIRL